jgi:hypothetical protein
MIIILLSIYSKELKAGTQAENCILVFKEIFTTAKSWKQPKCPIDKWVNKM